MDECNFSLSLSLSLSGNVQMQAALRQTRQPSHETKHHGPPAVQPRPFCKLPKNNVGRDALAELTEIAEEGNLDVLHVFQLWDQGQGAGRSPDLAPIRDCGEHDRIKEAPHHGKGFVTHQSLVLGRQAGWNKVPAEPHTPKVSAQAQYGALRPSATSSANKWHHQKRPLTFTIRPQEIKALVMP